MVEIVVALLGAGGPVVYLLTRLDRRNSQQHDRNMAQLERVADSVDRVGVKVDRLDSKVDRLDARLDAHLDWHLGRDRHAG